MSAADRRQIQAALHRLGYDPGPVDGLFGPLTRVAIRHYQQSIGAEQTGIITADQASRLQAQLAAFENRLARAPEGRSLRAENPGDPLAGGEVAPPQRHRTPTRHRSA